MLANNTPHGIPRYPILSQRSSRSLTQSEKLVKSSSPSLPSYEDDPFIGRVLAERYEILSVIGIGGWSTVYMARDQVLSRIVAIKLLHQQHALDPQRTQRFL